MKTKKITVNAFIAALYVVLTLVSWALGLAYGPIQFRMSEILVLLPAISFSFTPGIVLGCAISNLLSFNILDCIVGTFATFIAAILTYLLRNIRFKGLPLLSALPPIIINALAVGLEISLFLTDNATFSAFVYSSLTVALGQTAVLGVSLVIFPFFKKILDK